MGSTGLIHILQHSEAARLRAMEEHSKGMTEAPLWKYHVDTIHPPPGYSYTLNQWPLYDAASVISKIRTARKQSGKVGMASLAITQVTHLAIYISLPSNVRFYEPIGPVLTKEHSPLIFKLKQPPDHFKHLGPRDQRERKKATNLGGAPDFHHQKGIDFCIFISQGNIFLSPRWETCLSYEECISLYSFA